MNEEMCMFERDEILEFLHKTIDIGIPRFEDNDRLFYYTGVLTEVTQEYIKLKLWDGIKQIPINDVIEIRLSRR